jgi:hypothetical protein
MQQQMPKQEQISINYLKDLAARMTDEDGWIDVLNVKTGRDCCGMPLPGIHIILV